MYPTTLAADNPIATQQMMSQSKLKRTNATMARHNLQAKVAQSLTLFVPKLVGQYPPGNRCKIQSSPKYAFIIRWHLGCKLFTTKTGSTADSTRHPQHGAGTGWLSKIQTFVPSSLTSFHHRNPTSKRPDTFCTVEHRVGIVPTVSTRHYHDFHLTFTVQKSAANRMINTTNEITKLLITQPLSSYRTMEAI